jgi:protease-4
MGVQRLRTARFSFLALVAVAAIAGCLDPLRLVTDSRLHVAGPIETKITAQMAAPGEAGPLLPMPIGPGDPQCACVALIDVDGILVNETVNGPYASGENPVAAFHEKLAAAGADPRVCAVVVRINSPGGGVAASQMMRHELVSFRQRTGRPVVACLMDVGAGGAYYLATACNVVYAQPGTVTGGIGVIFNVYNLRDAMAQFNVIGQAVRAGDNIDLGSPVHGIDKDSRRILQGVADEFHQQFRNDVLASRPLQAPVTDEVFDGRIFTASQALNLGLVDRVGSLEDALAEARRFARQPGAAVLMYRHKNNPPYSIYDTTPNVPLQATLSPISLPGIDRSRLPTFLYMWQPEPTLERLSGK